MSVKSKWRSKWMPRSNMTKVQRRSLKRSQAESKKALREMTGLNLVKFEMHINNVKTKEELQQDNK